MEGKFVFGGNRPLMTVSMSTEGREHGWHGPQQANMTFGVCVCDLSIALHDNERFHCFQLV